MTKRSRRLEGWLRRLEEFPWLAIYCYLGVLFLFAPTIVIFIASFNDSPRAYPVTGFTLDWYRDMFSSAPKFLYQKFAGLLQSDWYHDLLKTLLNPQSGSQASLKFLDGLWNSVYVAVVTAVFAGVVGTLAGFGLTRYKFRWLRTYYAVVLLPIILPGLLIGISLLSFFNVAHIQLSLGTVVISHAIFTIPFVVLVVTARLENFDISLEEAARDLGANYWQTFSLVTFPLIRSSIVGAMIIVAVLSIDEFVITFFTIGSQNTLPLVIWSMMRRGFSPTLNAISAVVLTASLVLTLVANRLLGVKVY